jgi:hypothetical protein
MARGRPMLRNESSNPHENENDNGENVKTPIDARVAEIPRREPMVTRAWALRGSTWRIYLMSFLIAAGIFLVTTVLHYVISPQAVTVTRQPLADLASALLVGLLAYRSYAGRRERMQQVFARLRMVAEINHHVRNALETITLRIYSTGDRKLIEDVSHATQRIDWALREILADGNEGNQ